jgi:uncharacterized protein (TIGR00645 family)
VFAVAKIMRPESRDHTPLAERWLEALLFSSRWLMAPFYLGLVVALGALLIVFLNELATEVSHIVEVTPESAILMGLSLIDMSLAGNLLLIVIFSGYENFVSKLDAGDRDRPAWMGTLDFGAFKLKLISSIVAISAISLLRSFMKISEGLVNETALKWSVIIHLTFVTSGVLLASSSTMRSLSGKRKYSHTPWPMISNGFVTATGDGVKKG